VSAPTEQNNKIKSLPHLPLDEQTTHITQEMADRIIDHLVERYPYGMEKIVMYAAPEDDGNALMAYQDTIGFVRDNESEFMPAPQNELEYIELQFELVRRCRAFFGYALPDVLGKPLAPSIDGPYPEKLMKKPIFLQSLFDAGFTQELVDAWGDEFYKTNQKACFIIAESGRRSLILETNPILPFFRKKAEATGSERLIFNYAKAADELRMRISLTCNIVTLDRLKKAYRIT